MNEKVKCKNCENGLVLVPRVVQVADGVETVKLEPTICTCCAGDYRDCRICRFDEIYGEEEE